MNVCFMFFFGIDMRFSRWVHNQSLHDKEHDMPMLMLVDLMQRYGPSICTDALLIFVLCHDDEMCGAFVTVVTVVIEQHTSSSQTYRCPGGYIVIILVCMHHQEYLGPLVRLSARPGVLPIGPWSRRDLGRVWHLEETTI